MKHSDFRVGCEFLSGNGRWRCTDVGTRIITAIKLNHDDDPSWYIGPPYKVVESVFDEYDFEGCEKAPRQRGYDDSGRSEIVTVPRQPLPAKSAGEERTRLGPVNSRDNAVPAQ
jgi:hypothetical protein